MTQVGVDLGRFTETLRLPSLSLKSVQITARPEPILLPLKRSRPMRSPSRRIGAVLTVACFMIVASIGVVTTRGGQPTVILITVDTLRADRLGAYGYAPARTPNIDALADSGVTFTQATTPFPRTTPAIASLFTGLRPEVHGSREVQQPIEHGRLMAEFFAAKGWDTIGVSSNNSAGSRVGLGLGFRLLDEELNIAPASFITERALERVSQADFGRPLFLWVHYIDPHWPYAPPSAWVPEGVGEACAAAAARIPRGLLFGNFNGEAERIQQDCSRLYDAEIAFVDWQVGLLLAGLRDLGRVGVNSLIVFTSDHGENLGEDGLYFEHGPSASDASIRVPLIFAGRGIRQGGRDPGVARLEDVLPTILDYQGWSDANLGRLNGESLVPRLTDWVAPDISDRVALIESGSALDVRDFGRLVSGTVHGGSCVNGERYSLCSKPSAQPALFDHLADPFLIEDLSAQHPDVVARLHAQGERWPAEHARQRAIRTSKFKLVQRPIAEGGYAYALFELGAASSELDVSSSHPKVLAALRTQLEAWTTDLERSQQITPSPRTDQQLDRLRALGYIAD